MFSQNVWLLHIEINDLVGFPPVTDEHLTLERALGPGIVEVGQGAVGLEVGSVAAVCYLHIGNVLILRHEEP